MHTITIPFAPTHRNCEVVVGSNLLRENGFETILLPLLSRALVVIVYDTIMGPSVVMPLVRYLEQEEINARAFILPAGEKSKTLSYVNGLISSILELESDSNTVLIGIGGGVIGDMTGFVASILFGGVPYVLIPTTLVAQVDSSIGAKTAVNYGAYKNILGTIYPPSKVLCETTLLATLPERHMRAGMAEIIKIALVADADFFAWLETHTPQTLLDPLHPDCTAMIARAIQLKANLIAHPPLASTSQLSVVHFGHTFGHALESMPDFSDLLLHSEAVAIGMMLALRLGVSQNLTEPALIERVHSLLKRYALPTDCSDLPASPSPEALLEALRKDKKCNPGAPQFILLKDIGESFISDATAYDVVLKFLKNLIP
jgi:3-dehydroquinate synthetase